MDAKLEGWRFATEFNARWRMAELLRGIQPPRTDQIDAIVDALEAGKIRQEEWETLPKPERLFVGRSRRDPARRGMYAALEISIVVDTKDVRRAADRAETLRKCGLDAIAVVGGREVTAVAKDLAAERAVEVLVDRGEPEE